MQTEPLAKQADGYEKSRYCSSARDFLNFMWRGRRHVRDQFLYRHRGEVPSPSRNSRTSPEECRGLNRQDTPFGGPFDSLDLPTGQDNSALFHNSARHFLPHLAGTELRVEESLNEGSLGFPLCSIAGGLHGLLDRMRKGLQDRKPLDPLGAPFRADLIASHTPKLSRV